VIQEFLQYHLVEQGDKPKPPQVVIPGAFGDARLPMASISFLLFRFGKEILLHIGGMNSFVEHPWSR
jgi:hypothetical protein